MFTSSELTDKALWLKKYFPHLLDSIIVQEVFGSHHEALREIERLKGGSNE